MASRGMPVGRGGRRRSGREEFVVVDVVVVVGVVVGERDEMEDSVVVGETSDADEREGVSGLGDGAGFMSVVVERPSREPRTEPRRGLGAAEMCGLGTGVLRRL